jgi:hypothetical protein
MHDATYFQGRATSHLHHAARAAHPLARKIHLELASLYQARASEAGLAPPPHPDGEVHGGIVAADIPPPHAYRC